jgi:hypothetical protein
VGGTEAGSGSTSASILSQSDCHAAATIVASSWRRDFLLALIGSLVAVGIHMMFQAMVEAAPGRRRGQGHTAGAGAEAGEEASSAES